MASGVGASRQPVGFTFTETMRGYIAPGVAGYRQAAARGRALRDTLRFTVTVTILDLNAFLEDPAHPARLTGSVTAPRFGGTLPIYPGDFHLLVADGHGHLQMRYRFTFRDGGGARYRLDGFKDVTNDHVVDVWTDTTTLFVTIHREGGARESVVATGVLHIRPLDLIGQVRSMRALNAARARDHVGALLRFGGFFTARLWREYAPSLKPLLRRRSAAGVLRKDPSDGS